MNKIVSIEEFDFAWFSKIKVQKKKVGNPGNNKKIKYLDLVTAFDIETSKIITNYEYNKVKKTNEPRYQAFMYIWMWQFGDKYTVVGRTWDEYIKFSRRLKYTNLRRGVKLVTYVHNLAYEFQFLKGIYNFACEDVFSLDRRKVLKAVMNDFIELRCSYIHSNMSLNVYTKKMGAEHSKLSGEEFDYNEIRYPWTELTDRQIQYCVHDVLGLVEALTIEMKHDNDNLYTIPLTSTGYVRRDAKKAMRNVSHDFVKEQLPDLTIYKMCREAFRGGNTHANRYYAGQILEGVKSADMASAYPTVQCNAEFPITEFTHVGGCTFADLIELINVRKKAVLMRVSMTNVKLHEYLGCPYLARDKCRNIRNAVYDNGRILECDYLETTITDIDLRIIIDQYDFTDFVAFEVAHARYGKLPRPLIDATIKYYEVKTTMKNVEGQELYYMKSKNKLNSIYGMMAQDPVKQSIDFINYNEFEERNDDIEELLNASNKRAFLAYQWGVWVTAWARYKLQEGINLAGDGFVYCDTDSVKYIGEIDWDAFNKKRIAESKASGAFATAPDGVTHYMGVYEMETDHLPGGAYHQFVTLGAKKYSYRETKQSKLSITIAGVTKAKGGLELEEHDGIHSFKPGFMFVKAGGTESVYNDNPPMQTIKIGNKTLHITSNIVIKDSTYTLGITAEYKNLLNNSTKILDI